MASADTSASAKNSKSGPDAKHKKGYKRGLKDLLKKMTFEVSLRYNRIRYPTWNEVLFPNNFTTGVILGQLPDEDMLNRLIQRHGVTSVVSCVEQFELDKFNLNFAALHVAQLTLPQKDFSRMDPKMLEDGAKFLMKQLNVTSGSLHPAQLGPRSYVHCKAGRGRSTAVVVAYMLNLGFEVEDAPAGHMDKRLDIRTCYDFVLKCRDHISCGQSKLEDIHVYYLRVRARRGIMLNFGGEKRDAWIKTASACCLKSVKVLRELHRTDAKLKERVKDLEKEAQSLAAFTAHQDLKNRRDELAKICNSHKEEYDRLISDEHFHYSNRVEKWLTTFYDRHNSKHVLEVQNVALLYEKNLPGLIDDLRKKYPKAASELTDEILKQLSTVDVSCSDLKNDEQKISNAVQELCKQCGTQTNYALIKHEIVRQFGNDLFQTHKTAIENVLNANYQSSRATRHLSGNPSTAATAATAPTPSLIVQDCPNGFKLKPDEVALDWTDRCDGRVSRFKKLYNAGKLKPLPKYVFVRSTIISDQRGADVFFRISEPK